MSILDARSANPMVEQNFRTAKSFFATRLIFHKLDETIRGRGS